MYDGIRGGGSYWYSIFFVACVGLGQFVALNLFLAVLLSNIDTSVSGVRSLSLLKESGGGGRTPRQVLADWPKRVSPDNALLSVSRIIADTTPL